MLLSLDVIGLVPGMLAWAVAALGMGIVSPTLSTQLLSLAPVSEQGRVSAAQGLAISTGVALSTGVVGAVVALRGAETDGVAFGLLMAGGAAAPSSRHSRPVAPAPPPRGADPDFEGCSRATRRVRRFRAATDLQHSGEAGSASGPMRGRFGG